MLYTAFVAVTGAGTWRSVTATDSSINQPIIEISLKTCN